MGSLGVGWDIGVIEGDDVTGALLCPKFLRTATEVNAPVADTESLLFLVSDGKEGDPRCI